RRRRQADVRLCAGGGPCNHIAAAPSCEFDASHCPLLLLDLGATSEAPPVSVDVCIVGAGAAGLTIARELANRPIHICLVEGGGLNGDREAQALLRGEIVGRPYFPLEQVRISGFGGTTTIWNGACRPLDAIDFSRRGWVPWSGWPITREHLDP